MEFKDYYQSLGVTKHATPDEIKKAFRKQARKYHPDVNPGDAASERRFKELNEAHEVLSDPVTRRKYDELGSNWKQYERAQASGQPFGGGSPFAAGGGPSGGGSWNVNTGGPSGAGFRTMSEDDVRSTFGDDPFSDFFQTFFSGAGGPFRDGRHQRQTARQRGRHVEHELELNLEDACAGVTTRLTLSTGGRARTVEVRIPAGVTDGSKVRVAGEGEPGAAGAAAGDLYLRVRLAPHPVFERRGRNLEVTVDVSLTTAVLGGEIDVPTIDGKTVRLKLPPATQQGQKFRLKGRGMPTVRRGGQRGHLYAVLRVKLPERLTAEERAHYEALAELERPSGRARRSAKDPAA